MCVCICVFEWMEFCWVFCQTFFFFFTRRQDQLIILYIIATDLILIFSSFITWFTNVFFTWLHPSVSYMITVTHLLCNINLSKLYWVTFWINSRIVVDFLKHAFFYFDLYSIIIKILDLFKGKMLLYSVVLCFCIVFWF